MTRRAVVHIGIDKTGSTTIQQTLFALRSQLLSDAGILYPSIAANHTIPLGTMFRDKPPPLLRMLEPDATDERSIARVRERYRASFEADLSNPGWRTLVISAEGLSGYDPRATVRLVEWLTAHVSDISVVAYVRHPVDWVRSVTQQRLKQGETLGQAHESMRVPRWRRRFTPWLDAVGLERFRLVSFDHAREHDGIMASFCDAARLPREKILPRALTTSANESMSLEAALLLDSLNRQRPLFVDGKVSPARRSLGLRYGIDVLQSVPGNRFYLDAEHEAKARADSRPELEWLNATFGTNLFPEVFEDTPPEATLYPNTMPKESVDALAIMLADLLGNQCKDQKDRRG